MNSIMLSCHKATALIEKNLENKANSKDKVQIFMHTRFCNACTNYQKQSQQLDEILKKEGLVFNAKSEIHKRKLPPKVKNEIIEKLKDK